MPRKNDLGVLTKNARRVRLARSLETEERRKKRLSADRKRARERRKNETPEQRERRLEAERTRRALSRLKAKSRLNQNILIQKSQLLFKNNRSPLSKDAIRARLARSSETIEQRTRRLSADRKRALERRQKETPEQRERRLEADRTRKALSRLKAKPNLSQNGSIRKLKQLSMNNSSSRRMSNCIIELETHQNAFPLDFTKGFSLENSAVHPFASTDDGNKNFKCYQRTNFLENRTVFDSSDDYLKTENEIKTHLECYVQSIRHHTSTFRMTPISATQNLDNCIPNNRKEHENGITYFGEKSSPEVAADSKNLIDLDHRQSTVNDAVNYVELVDIQNNGLEEQSRSSQSKTSPVIDTSAVSPSVYNVIPPTTTLFAGTYPFGAYYYNPTVGPYYPYLYMPKHLW